MRLSFQLVGEMLVQRKLKIFCYTWMIKRLICHKTAIKSQLISRWSLAYQKETNGKKSAHKKISRKSRPIVIASVRCWNLGYQRFLAHAKLLDSICYSSYKLKSSIFIAFYIFLCVLGFLSSYRLRSVKTVILIWYIR